MRVAALYDVHGNLPALEAVLGDPRCAAADAIVCGGDLVVGPYPAECLDALEAYGEPVRFITGNCDREAVEAPPAGELGVASTWSNERLGRERTARVGRWPLTVALELPDTGRVLFCHATPTSDLPILTRITPEDDVARELGDVSAVVVVCGHTHVQYDRRVGSVRLVNAGSVGMPYEGSGDARWALLADGEVELVTTAYDTEAALARLEQPGFPLFRQWFVDSLRGDVSAEEATTSFESRRVAQ
ncbi:MAG TPA: metallophosphoesterase family protein [Gaiella sp.]|nr:metallophosphoesterase family protein [Gaiella sp.]